MRCVLRCADGPPESTAGPVFPSVGHRLFRRLSSERGIAWRVADSLSLRSFLDLDVTEAAPDHSTLSRTRRRIDVETHVSVFTWVLERLADAGLVRGKTVGIDATTLEANVSMRSIERRDDGRILRGVRAEFGGGVRGGDTDAGGSGSVSTGRGRTRASSAESVGEFRFGQVAKCVIQSDFQCPGGAEAIRPFGDHSGLSVEAFDNATGELPPGSEPVQNQVAVRAQPCGQPPSSGRAASASSGCTSGRGTAPPSTATRSPTAIESPP